MQETLSDWLTEYMLTFIQTSWVTIVIFARIEEYVVENEFESGESVTIKE